MTRRLWQRAAAGGLGIVLVAGAAWAQEEGINVEKYVALGDSLTAAFSSGGLSIEQQVDSYPALIHQAFQAVGGPTEPFEQPLVSAPGLPSQLELRGLFPTVIAPRSNQPGQPINFGLQRPYDNLGVPGARMHDVVATVTKADNPLFDLVLRGAGTALQQTLRHQPTLVTVQIGNNDVLDAATSGIVIDGLTLTPVAPFETDLRFLLKAIVDSGAQIAIANLPNVTTVPFVSTLPPFVIDERGQPVLINGETVPVIGPNGPLGPGDHVLLRASLEAYQFGIGIPTSVGGTGQPLPDDLVLDAAETARVQERVAALNEVIAAAAEEHGAALVDVNALLDGIVNNGLTLGGIDFSADFLTGGLFSYDGVHPTRLGYGVLANAFIEAINETFGAAIPPVDLERLAFEPPAVPAATTRADLHVTGAGSRWTPFVYSAEAWQNLQLALGIRGVSDSPEASRSPTSPDRPDRFERVSVQQQSHARRADSVRPSSVHRQTPTEPGDRIQRRSPQRR